MSNNDKKKNVCNEEKWAYVTWIEGIPADKYQVSTNGRVFNTYTNKFVRASLGGSRRSYLRVGLNNSPTHGEEPHVSKGVKVARLVAMAFVPIPAGMDKSFIDYLCVYQTNDDPSDVTAANVRWGGWEGCPKKTKKHVKAGRKEFDQIEGEEWKFIDWIPDIPADKYMVSSMGRVYNVYKDRMIGVSMCRSKNYVRAILSDDGPKKTCGVEKTCSVNVMRLVARAFLPIPEEFKSVDVDYLAVTPKDGYAGNVNIDNIEWTLAAACFWKRANRPNKLTAEQLEVIRACLIKNNGSIEKTYEELKCEFDDNFKESTVSSIKRFEITYRDIPEH